MAWAPDYVSASELAAFMRIDDSDDDVQLALAVSAASRAVDNHCNRQFGQVGVAEQRLYTAEWDRRRCRWVVPIDDLMDDTALTVTTEAGEIDSYVLEPVNAKQKGRPAERLVVKPGSSVSPTGEEHGVTASAPWGWTTVPDPVKEATLLQGSRVHSRRTSPFGIAGSPETGSEVRLLARVDPDVAVSLSPFVRWWGAV